MSADQHYDELPDDLADRAAEQLLGVVGPARAAALAALIAAHPEHQQGLQRLQAALAGADRLLEGTFPNREEETATHIGGHRVIRKLGEGAFGIVFLCAQEQPVVRHVAIKVLRPGAGDDKTLRRFAAERQLLATLNHPAITQVFDAGVMPDGRPFFVMEYVDGQTIRRYCDERLLPCRDRLRLFIELCRGVAHAHKRGIVHRDLKPTNVLVVEAEGGPLPKIIDFGIAKALFAAPGSDGLRTETGRVIGTPGYMSPEQAAGRTEQVDERADVFALGVMLYELLTGELPWVRGAAATDTEPMRPSARVPTTTSSTVAATATRRQRAAELRGDLDWITLRALARDREERYATVNALAEDLEHHLRGEPVSVGPPSATYRLRKFVRRNRTVVVVSCLAIAASGVAWAGSFVHSAAADQTTARAEAAAETRYGEAKVAVDQLLARASDERMRRSAQSDGVRQALVQDALSFYDRWLTERPEDVRLRLSRCRALVALSQVHWQLAQMADAERTASEAVEDATGLLMAVPGDLSRRALLAEAQRRWARALAGLRRQQEAKAPLVAAVAHLEAGFAAAPTAHGLSLSSASRELASVLQILGEIEPAFAANRRSVAVLEQYTAAGGTDPTAATDLAISRGALAQQLLGKGELDEAAAVLTQAESGLSAITLDRPRVTALVQAMWGQLAMQKRETKPAVERLSLAVAAAEQWRQLEPNRLLPYDSLLVYLRQLAAAQERARAWPAANAVLARAVEVAEAMATEFPEDPTRVRVLYFALRDFARQLWDRYRQVDLELADTWVRRAVEVHERVVVADPKRSEMRWECLLIKGCIGDARGIDTQSLWEEVASLMPSAPAISAPGREHHYGAWSGVVKSRLRHGQLDEAAEALQRTASVAGLDKAFRTQQLAQVAMWNGQLALRRSDPAGAVVAAERVLELRSTWYGKGDAAELLCDAWHLLAAAPGADATSGVDCRDRAAVLWDAVIADLQADVDADPDDPWQVVPWGFAGVRLALVEAARGDPDAARSRLAKALPGLDRVAAMAHRDLWPTEVLEQGRALQQTLQKASGR